jgi:GntR family transcriptional regulator
MTPETNIGTDEDSAPAMGVAERRGIKPRPRGSLPLNREIENFLRQQIVELEVGARLPSEIELAKHFSTTRSTVRSALQRLEAEGVIQRVAGSGTFVCHPPPHRQLRQLLSFSEEMRKRGREPSSKVVFVGVRPANDRERTLLRLSSDARIIEIKRLRFADNIPIAIQDVVLPERFAFVLDKDLEANSLYSVLASTGVVPSWSKGTIRAQLAQAEDARYLSTAPYAALLVETRTTYDQRGEPIELVESRYEGERLVLDVWLGSSSQAPTASNDTAN